LVASHSLDVFRVGLLRDYVAGLDGDHLGRHAISASEEILQLGRSVNEWHDLGTPQPVVGFCEFSVIVTTKELGRMVGVKESLAMLDALVRVTRTTPVAAVLY
jgi:hypothetical protein